MDTLSTITGWCGALLLLLGYGLTVLKVWKVDSGRYMLLSCVAAVLLITNAAVEQAYPFLVVNIAILL